MKCFSQSLFVLCLWGLLADSPSSADAKPEKFKISEEEQKILDQANEARKEEKLPPLKPNPTLFKVARAHSINMAKQEKMDHVLDGKNPADRVKAAGYKYSYVGENVAEGENWPLTNVHKAWMESEHHRENILKDKFTEIGIGVARGESGKTYYTQVFGSPQKKR